MLKIPGVSGAAATVTATSAAAVDAATGAPPPPPAPVDPYVVKLSKPLQTHKGIIHELRLRDPIGSDFIEIGRVPFDVRGESEDRRAVVDFKLAGQWLSRLTDIDVILLGNMSNGDWLVAVARLNSLIMRSGASVGN